MKRPVRYRSPDGIDWRDPDMPVLRPMEDGFGRRYICAVGALEEQEYARDHLAHAEAGPTWREDPTYAMRSERWRRRQRLMRTKT